MLSLKGVIFDMDGVLCFTDQYHYLGWKHIADKNGIYFDEIINHRLRGVSRAESLEIILEQYHGPALTIEQKQKMMNEKNDYYRSLLNSMTPDDVTDEVRETLAVLRERGYRLAIGSSSKNAQLILEKTGLTPAFDAVADGNVITHSKPDPEVFLKAAEFLELAPSDCLVVEDAYAGIDAAKAGGMLAAGIGEAASYKKTDYVLHTFSDLLSITASIY